MTTTETEKLLRLYRTACDRLDGARLAASVADELAPGTRLLGLGKTAHRQVAAVLAARADVEPLVSVSTTRGGHWAMEGAHPVPDERSFVAGEALLFSAQEADGADIALFLSGGGSSLATVAAEGVDEAEKVALHRRLLVSGLDIGRMNIVRRALSGIKGGRLAASAPRARWRVYVTSDVPDDDLATISSGPCVARPEQAGEAVRVLRGAGLWSGLSAGLQARLSQGRPPVDLSGTMITHRLLAGPRRLGQVVEQLLAEEGETATVLAPVSVGVEELARRYARWAAERLGGGPATLVATGEPTLAVRGSGLGGRSQHLALLLARMLEGRPFTFLAAGTDGRDGPTSHAGAIVDGDTAFRAGSALDVALALDDSAPLHARLGTAIPAWDSPAHVGDLHLLRVN